MNKVNYLHSELGHQSTLSIS